MEIRPVQTKIEAKNGQVLISHSALVGTQWLSPEQARAFAGMLFHFATVAEGQRGISSSQTPENN